jgi:hypothetical protein
VKLADSHGRLPKICKASPPHKSQLIVQFHQGFEFFSFRSAEKTFVVAVNEFLQAAVGLRWKMKSSNCFHPVQRAAIVVLMEQS